MGKVLRHLGKWIFFSSIIFIVSCTLSEKEAPSKKTVNVSIDIIEPNAIKNSGLDLLQIHGLLTIESSTFLKKIPFLFNNKKIDPITINLVEDSYNFQVEFEFHDAPYLPCRNVQLLESSIQRTVSVTGVNNIVFAKNHSYAPSIDDDGDQISNLDELDYSSNPCDPNQTPVLNIIRVRHNILSFGYPTDQGMTISWQPAVHQFPGTNLEYLWISSSAANISNVRSINSAIDNNAPTGSWSTNTSAIITNINAPYTKYWNVMVRDSEKNLNVYAQARPNGLGILDTKFSDNLDGILSLKANLSKPNGSQGLDMAIDNNHKIFIAGRELNSTDTSSIAVWSYDQSGNAVNTFGNGLGMAVLQNPSVSSNDAAHAIVLDKSNSIFITGQIGNNNSNLGHNMILWKLFISGIADANFGDANGYVIFDGIKGLDTTFSVIGNAITIDNNGNILVAGFAQVNTIKTVIVVWRYNNSGINNGKLDLSFGNGKGYITHNGLGGDINKPQSNAYAIAVDRNDNIYVAGYTANADGGTELALWKFDNDGNSAINFGNHSGFATHHIAADNTLNDAGHALQLDNANRIVITGVSQSSANIQSMALWRYQNNGQLDNTFASGQGYLTHNIPTGNSIADSGHSIDIDRHNNIVVAGSYSNGNNNLDMSIWRFTSVGILDTSFGPSGGYVTQHNATLTNEQSNDVGNRLIITANGRYLVTGKSQDINGVSNMTMWQYQ